VLVHSSAYIVTGMTKGFSLLSRFGRRDKYVLSMRPPLTHSHIMCVCVTVHASPLRSARFLGKRWLFRAEFPLGLSHPRPIHPHLPTLAIPHTHTPLLVYIVSYTGVRVRYIRAACAAEVATYTHTHTPVHTYT